MKKRVLCIVLMAAMVLSLSISAFAAHSDVSIVIDKEEVEFTASSGEPFVDANGRTQVPLRVVMEQYGCDVEWDSENNAAVITKGNTTVIVPIGQSYILVNGKTVAMDTAALVQNGRTINAGNVGVGGSMSGLTFADYSVGTKFYLTQPTGAFDVTVNVNNTPYVIEFDSVYYELTAKNDYSDADAWIYKKGSTYFRPYEATMFIEGQADTALAGQTINIGFSASDDAVMWAYKAVIDTDGSFSVIFTQGDNKTTPWYAPKTLFLRNISISGNSSTPSTPEPDEEELAIAAMLAKVAGTWYLPSDTEKTFTITTDGTITYNGTDYTPRYSMDGNVLWADVSGCADVSGVMFDSDATSARVYGDNSGYYCKDGSWDVVTLTKDNFFTYYEYKEDFTINYNAFGEYENAYLAYYYVLKDEYASSLIKSGSTAAAKIQLDTYSMEYVIDFENESYTVTEPGELLGSNTYSLDCRLNNAATIMLGGTGTYANNTTNTARFYKIQFIDATGTLYLIKNS